MDTEKFLIFFRKRIEPFIALGVLILLITLSIQLMNGNELRTEISQNCGWGDEEFRCFCEKSEAMAIKNKIEKMGDTEEDIDYVWMDR